MNDHQISFTPLPDDLLKAIGADVTELVDTTRAVYTNRDLDMATTKLVGFDMDYTLAIYNKAPMEQLQYDLTVEALVKKMGYPASIRALKYDPHFVIRGLVVDKRSGHIVKMDTHGRVCRVYHGHRRLDVDEMESAYRDEKLRLGSNAVASADTLFSMPEVCLYANLVAFFEARASRGEDTAPLTLPASLVPAPADSAHKINTWKLFDDVREGIDTIHRDGTLKSVIMADLKTYFVHDDMLATTLHKMRSAGKRLFLLTNSYWIYTEAVMSHLLDGQLKEYANWKQYFDIILVGGKKPKFFTDREPFLEVAPVAGVEQVLGEVSGEKFERGHVYQGGNMVDFERMVRAKGEEILYVGDHIFGDIVRSRKDSRWRTCLIVEELEQEIRGSLSQRDTIEALNGVDRRRMAFDAELSRQRALLVHIETALEGNDEPALTVDTRARLEDAQKKLKKEIDVAKRALRALDGESKLHGDLLDKSFNPFWGRLFKAGNELSRFGAQVETYACTYTSRVSNFSQYSPMQFFRAPREHMVHDDAL
jgi:5'-nucleotidase